MADEDGSGSLELDEMVALGQLIDARMSDDMGLDALEDQVRCCSFPPFPPYRTLWSVFCLLLW